jgi:hypothetical protein
VWICVFALAMLIAMLADKENRKTNTSMILLMVTVATISASLALFH